uniref:COMM domain-containing protein 7-like n=1 Tax=Sinocyclocheilus grahami TaxID=75366 RepID=A0A672PR95_SINGR
MLQLHFTNDTLPDNACTDFQNVNKFREQQFVSLTEILYQFLLEPKESERFLRQLTEFAGENGMSAGPLRALMKSVLLLPHGLNEDKASHFSDQWRIHYPVLSRLAVGQTLMVNQLVDMEWKFGVTVGTSELQKTGNIFLQLKLVIRKGNKTENVYMELTLPQFYNFLHEMGRAKASMDCFN